MAITTILMWLSIKTADCIRTLRIVCRFVCIDQVLPSTQTQTPNAYKCRSIIARILENYFTSRTGRLILIEYENVNSLRFFPPESQARVGVSWFCFVPTVKMTGQGCHRNDKQTIMRRRIKACGPCYHQIRPIGRDDNIINVRPENHRHRNRDFAGLDRILNGTTMDSSP